MDERQTIGDSYALYNGDCMDVMGGINMESIPFSIYSPPFGGIYMYSGDERDLSNHAHMDDFFDHYGFIVDNIRRITIPGRMTAVHCTDIPRGGYGNRLFDLPGKIITLHEEHGFHYVARYHVWKEPLTVRNRTMMKSLHHKTFCEDTSRCAAANADYLLIFRKRGDNPIPIEKPNGVLKYAGERKPPADTLRFRGWKGNQIENRYSQWVWQQYASAFWDDIRLDHVVPFKEAREDDDEKHVHPLQLDVIERAITLWSNPGETVFTPFMGVGSEAYVAVLEGRKAVGVELKTAYYKQAVRNVIEAASGYSNGEQEQLFHDQSA